MDWGIIIPIVALVLIFGPRMLGEIKDYLLKKEQIKADTELKAEALRLKNALELEKFMETGNVHSDSKNNTSRNDINETINEDGSDSLNQRRNSQYEKY